MKLRKPGQDSRIATISQAAYFQLLAASILLVPAASAQIPDTLVAIRDSAGANKLVVFKTGALVVRGDFDNYSYTPAAPAQGAGTRMMWYPERAAFRAGHVSGSQWNDPSIGYHSLAVGENVQASGDHSVALGKGSYAVSSSAFAAGDQCVASGAASVAMGYQAHGNTRQGSFTFADRSTVDTLRAGAAHTANWRVSGGFRIFTSPNLSSGVTIQSGANVSHWGQANAVISTSTGAYLSTSGIWTNVSDVHRKHLIEKISGKEVLARLRSLSISRWSYRVDDPSIRHIGPMAQDFHAAFGLGNDNRTIGTVDADGVALASAQALEARTRLLASQLQEAKSEAAELRERLDTVEKRLSTGIAGMPVLVLLGTMGVGGMLLRRKAGKRKDEGNEGWLTV